MPSPLTVYVPWPAMVNDVSVQFGAVCGGDVLGSHNFTLEATSGALGAPGSSLVSSEMTCGVFQLPTEVSSSASGAGASTGVSSPVAVRPMTSVTL